MFNCNKFLLLASSALVVSGTMNLNIAYASSYKVLGTHTTHLPLELKPDLFNSSPSFKLAAICALGDEECGLNIGFGNSDKDTSAGAKKCRSNGYVLTSNCAAPKVAGAKCPYHPNYSKPCSCPTSYAQTCSAPYIGVGTGCDNKFTSCQCAATYKYSCTGTGYTGGSGTKCDSKFTACSCANGYNWNGSACVANSCSGYTASTCPAPKTTSTPNCLSATTQYYASCTCPTTYKYSCSGTGYAGGTGTGCDGKYTACSCANGYNWNGSSCVANSCSGYTTSNCTSPKMLRTPNCLSATTQYYASCTCPASYQFSCSGTGYSGGNGSKCDAKFETCNCTSDYTWNGSACVPKVRQMSVGDIYYSDKTFSPSVISGKDAIGIVFWVNNDNNVNVGNKALVTALEAASKYWNDGSDNWTDIPDLANKGSRTAALADMDGKSNTNKIIKFQNSSGQTHQAADYCANYSTSGTAKGQWFLPSAGQLLYLRNAKNQVNASLSLLGKETMTQNHWTSTPETYYSSWEVEFYSDSCMTSYSCTSSGAKYSKGWRVRPVMAL